MKQTPDMKVLQLTKFFPPVMGGIESVVFQFAEHLNRLGISTDVLCAHTEKTTSCEIAAGGYRITRAATWGKLLSTSMAPALVLELMTSHRRYDLIHVHLPDPMTNLALYLVRPESRLVVHWHSDIVQQRRALKIYAPLQQWLLRRADAIVATSPPYAESSPWLAEFRDKLSVIPLGIEDAVPQAEPGQVQRLREQLGTRRIVFALGRMTYYKGFEVLIDAAARLPEDVVVVVGGSGELLEHYRQQAHSRGLARRIRFVGRIAPEELPVYQEAASLFCLPSTARAEAFGVVLLEAMARGKPIVATDIAGSGVPWVNQHGHTGLNVPPRDSAALATAICTLLDDPARAQRMGAAGRQRFAEHFTADLMMERTLELYGQVLARDGGR